jgi:outer membrane protein insertion porin family
LCVWALTAFLFSVPVSILRAQTDDFSVPSTEAVVPTPKVKAANSNSHTKTVPPTPDTKTVVPLSNIEMPTPAPNAATNPPTKLPRIHEIKVEGLKNLEPEAVKTVMITHRGDLLSLRKIREDIHNLYGTGDYDTVDVSVESTKNKEEVDLLVTVKERLKIHEVVFKGNEKKKAKKLAEKMKLVSKKPMDPALLSGDLEEVKKLYREDGYSNVSVDAQTKECADGKSVDLILTVNEGNQIKVGQVVLEGVKSYSEKKIRGKLKENKPGKKYRPDKLDEDIQNIEDFYRNEGFLRASILSHEAKPSEDGKTININIVVREGVAYQMGELSFEGNAVVTNNDMTKAAHLEMGKPLKQKDMEDALQRIRTLYLDKGYIYCNIVDQPDYNDETKTANLHLKIVEGQIAFIQDIKIVGNYKTRDYVIRREIDLKPGDKFEATGIRASAGNLYNLGFFDEVNPEVEPGDKPGQAVLVYRVKERKTGSISLGGGYSSVDKLVGNVKVEEANLFGRGQKVTAEWEVGKSILSYDLGFTEPWLFNTKTSMSIDLFNTTHILDYYTEKRMGASLGLGRRLSRRWSIFDTYMYEKVRIQDVSSIYSDPTQTDYIPTSLQYTSSMTPRIAYDSRDNYFDPHRGYRHQLSVEIAGGPFGAQNNYIKITPESSGFFPLFWKFVLGEHVRLGIAKGYKANGRDTDVPLFEKFFCGGTDTVRGYDERIIGPNKGVTGGNLLFVWNSEFKYPIIGPLRGVLFWDVGGLWNDFTDFEHTSGINHDLQSGYGLGIRLTIPGTVMSIRLDYGWPYKSNIEGVSKSGKLHFNLGDIF